MNVRVVIRCSMFLIHTYYFTLLFWFSQVAKMCSCLAVALLLASLSETVIYSVLKRKCGER